MGLFDNIRANFYGPPAAPPLGDYITTATRPIPRKQRKIDAGEVTRLTASWNSANLPADEEVKRSLERTRARSRDLAYNNEYAKKYLQMVGTHIVGPNGFMLQNLAADGNKPDRLARDAIELAFYQWAQRGTCEATGRLSFGELQRLIIEAVARDGEALLLRRRATDNAFGYELKLLEIDRLPVQKNDILKGGNTIVMGVELNQDGRAVAYWLNLGSLDTSGGQPVQLTRVPADDVIHLYRPARAEQHRGLPWMHSVMTSLKMLAGYQESSLVAARVGASKMGFYTSPDGTADPLADDKVDGEFYQDAEPGAFSVLPPGYDFKAWDPDYPHQNYDSFVKATLRTVASGLGIAYHTLANDLADVNYSSSRAGTIEERDNWIVLQNWFAESFLRPVYLDWLTEALKKGAITMPMGSALPLAKLPKWSVHQWQGRRWQWVDPMKDIEAARLAIKTGIASPQMIAAQNGVDIDDVLQHIKTFEDRVKEAGVTLIDYELTPAAPEPAPPPAVSDAVRIAEIHAASQVRHAEIAERIATREATPPVLRVEPHITLPAMTINVAGDTITVEPAQVRAEITTPAPVVNVAAPNVDVRVEALMPEQPAPIVEVKVETPDHITIEAMPERITRTEITRDHNGNITKSQQIETDATPAVLEIDDETDPA
jgi:lambda family phage portal protein